MPHLFRDETRDMAVCSAENARPPFEAVDQAWEEQGGATRNVDDGSNPTSTDAGPYNHYNTPDVDGGLGDQELDGADNAYMSVAHLDGTTPADTSECPVLTSQNVVSLGCGWVALEFVDATGSPLRFSTGDVIVIGEHGPACGEPEREEFEARLCTQRDADSCTRFHIGGAFQSHVTAQAGSREDEKTEE